LSYRAIQNVVNATRNVFSGDPFIELLAELEIDADGYNEVLPILNALPHKEILKASNVVANMATLRLGGEEVSVFYLGRTFIKVYSETYDAAEIEALNAFSGSDLDALEGDGDLLEAVQVAILELSTVERLTGNEFIYAKSITDNGVVYYGTARGFSGHNIFVITLSESGELLAIETLVIVDTLDYYEDIVVPGIARLLAEGAENQTAPDVFSGATFTGQSSLDIVLEAIAIQGGN
jgi:hypothetical protein